MLPRPNFATSGPIVLSSAEPVSAVTVIEASSGWVPLRIGELWEYREVLYFLVWRDLKARYRQTPRSTWT